MEAFVGPWERFYERFLHDGSLICERFWTSHGMLRKHILGVRNFRFISNSLTKKAARYESATRRTLGRASTPVDAYGRLFVHPIFGYGTRDAPVALQPGATVL